ncbi:DNA mismatch repair protein Msh6 [Calocera viscosa TUFC12733]|uniref:DNA mismatch repair protein n=1 Tax=Calocera viscosa (strain TUFC12733) TaxID=1330018 RepID=A0A167L3X7_CALVF|nr:DNA mismatch repair protein Msh6 [Calocera viscosa TUFC12733]
MPAKDTPNLKQKTLFSFLTPKNVSTPAKQTAPVSASLKDTSIPVVTLRSEQGEATNRSAQKQTPSASSAVPSVSFSSSSPFDAESPLTEVDEADGGRDIVMLDADDEVEVLATRRGKRKIVIEDSDDDVDPAIFAAPIRPAQRTSVPIRPPKKRRSSPATSRTAREDDFIPSESEPEIDDAHDFVVEDDEDDHEAPKKGKARGNPRSSKQQGARPAPKPIPTSSSSIESSNGGGGGNQFLTAAELRAQTAKANKKSQEECFDFLRDVRDRSSRRPGEEGYDPRTIFIPKSAWASFTPFEKQFWEIKQNHYDTVLMFQKGKFYELYEQDAEIGHREFDLKLTDRVKMKMVGVPESSFNFWAAKFLAKGYKVGRVDQVETQLGAEMRVAKHGNSSGGSGKEIVRRELNKVLTNGTLVDPELMVDDEAGHCVSIKEGENNTFGVCTLDAATGEFNLCAFEDDVCRTRLETLMRQLRPKELVHCADNLSIATIRLLKTVLPGSCLWTTLKPRLESWSYEQTLDELVKLYPAVQDSADPLVIEGRDVSGVPHAIRSVATETSATEALGGMIWYLGQLNVGKDLLTMRNFNIYDPMRRGTGLVLDGQTLAHVEVLLNSEGTDEGTLLKLLNRCVTPFGKRLFRLWLCMPLQEVQAINARLDAVDDLMNHPSFEGTFGRATKGLPDLERMVSRVHAKTCKAKDFDKLIDAFRQVHKGFILLVEESQTFSSPSVTDLLRSAPDLSPHLKNIQSMYHLRDELLYPVSGADEEYEKVQSEIDGLEGKLSKDLEKLKKTLSFNNLVFWHSAQGTKEIYLVEVPTSFKGVPKGWTKSGGTKSVSRWQVPELMGTIRKLKEARETLKETIKQYRFRLFDEFDADRDTWLRAVRVVAELDCLFSLTKSSQAIGEPSCRPQLVESDDAFVDFQELRHPAFLSDRPFIPNDVQLGGNREKIMLLTGPNMGGKSTLMRMTAAGLIMAQLGMYVPASSAKIAPVDAILTRMGAYDNMFTNASTFKVELDECCKILRHATPRSLVILDELGRGTSTFDGMAIAGAVLHHLATNTLPLSCFATHYSSLTEKRHPNIRNMHMGTAVDEAERQLVFLYKLIDGVATSSFGTHVASLAGVPSGVVERAEEISKDFAHQFEKKMASRRTSTIPIDLQADFAYLVKLATDSVKLDEDPVRAREVLAIIQRTAAMNL